MSDFWQDTRTKLLGNEDFKLSNINQLYSILSTRLALQLSPDHHDGQMRRHMHWLPKVLNETCAFFTCSRKTTVLSQRSLSQFLVLAACGIMLAVPDTLPE
jgi:hypothetical protein